MARTRNEVRTDIQNTFGLFALHHRSLERVEDIISSFVDRAVADDPRRSRAETDKATREMLGGFAVNINKKDVVDEFIESKADEFVYYNNTQVTLLYRDAGNYKSSVELIVAGHIPEEVKKSIEDKMIDSEFIDLAATKYHNIHNLFPDVVEDDELDHNYITIEFRPTSDVSDTSLSEFCDVMNVQEPVHDITIERAGPEM